MKTRRGFVSNSSSSSFVVAFPRRPKTVEDVMEMMFGSFTRIKSTVYPEDEPFAAYDIARCIFNNIGRKRGNNSREINKEFKGIEYSDGNAGGWFKNMADAIYESDDGLSFSIPKQADQIREIWHRNEIKRKKLAKSLGKSWLERHKDGVSYIFSFSDNDGEFYSFMEHGNIFRNLPHIRFSHH